MVKLYFGCFLSVNINVKDIYRWNIALYRSQAPESNRYRIVTDFVISANIVSASKHIDIISYRDEAGDLHP